MKKIIMSTILMAFIFVLGIGCVSATSNFTTDDIASASVSVKNHIETNDALPSSVVIQGQTVNTAQYLHLAVQATDQINSNNTASINLESDTVPSYQEEQLNTGTMSKADYVDFAQRVDEYMDDNHQAPPYGWIGLGKISYSSQIYLFSRVLTIYSCSGTLPPQITVKSWSTQNIPITESQSFNFTPDQISSASNTLKTKIESTKSIPSTVTVAGVNINTAQFLHLAVQATNQINNNNSSAISLSSDSIPGSQQEQLNGGSMSKADYVDFAQRVDEYMDDNHQAPPYGLIGLGTIGYSSEVYLFSRVLSIYYEYGRLPVYVRVKPWSAANIPIVYNPTTFTTEEIVAASVQLKNTIESTKMVSDVMVGPVSVNTAEYLQLAVLATIQINNNDTSAIPLLDDTAPSSQTESLNIGVLSKSDYIDFAQRINSYINNNDNQAPPYGIIGLGTMSYYNMIYTYSKILDVYNSLNMLPESIDVQPWAYILNPVCNNRTNERFNTIQAAINDADTHNGDILTLANITYIENVIVNKTLKIQPLSGNVIVRGLSTNFPVFTINSGGSGSTIMNLIIKGSTSNAGIFINNSVNNTIYNNNITGNQNGIYLNNSTGTNITSNTINNNTANGIYICAGINNTVYQNILKYNTHNGISVNSSENAIISNILTNNSQYGIYLYNSPTEIHFNQIFANTLHGLYVCNISNGTVNATNNWWGINDDPDSSINSSYVGDGVINYDPWLISTLNIENDTILSYEYEISVDVTKNNNSEDTSPLGNIPDGIPIYFYTTLGNITSPVLTKNGKAIATLVPNPSYDITIVSASLDNQTSNKTFEMLGLWTLLNQTITNITNLNPQNDSDCYKALNYTETVRIIVEELQSRGYQVDIDESMSAIVVTPPTMVMNKSSSIILSTGGETYADLTQMALRAFEWIGELRYFQTEEGKTICFHHQAQLLIEYCQLSNPNVNVHWQVVAYGIGLDDLELVKALMKDYGTGEYIDDVREHIDNCNNPLCPFGAPDLIGLIDVPSVAKIGETYTIDVIIENQGFVNCTQPFHVYVYSDHNNNYQQLSNTIIPSLDLNSSVVLHFSWTPTEIGSYILQLLIDPPTNTTTSDDWGDVYETFEKNNYDNVSVYVGRILCTLTNTTEYPSSTDPNQNYMVSYIYEAETPVYLNPSSRTPTFIFQTTSPVYSSVGFQAWYPWGAGKVYVSNSTDGPWTVVSSNPYFTCAEDVTTYSVDHWSMGTGYFKYFRIDMYTTALPWSSGIVKTFMENLLIN